MREIKFRGKRVSKHEYQYMYTQDNAEWAFGSLLVDIDNCYSIVNDHGGFRTCDEVIPETVGQFTGLRDSKRTPEYPEGQENYDGDNIVCRKYIGGNFVKYSIEKGIVSFKDGAFYLLREQGYYRPLSWLIEMDYELEVIGNIYDNPELVGDGPAEPA